MLDHINLSNVAFLDIETVPMVPTYASLDNVFKELWDKKASFLVKEGQTPEDIFQRAGIYAEFGKIICISMGFFSSDNSGMKLRLKSFYGDDERSILSSFSEAISKFFSKGKERFLCAHNGKEFDFPYISRRMLINGIPIPQALNVAGKKPWEVPFLDTMEFWKFGDYKSYTSLHLLTTILNIPTPKDDIDGSMVAAVYYSDGDLKRIASYCEKDVLAVVQIMQRFKGEEIITASQVELVG